MSVLDNAYVRITNNFAHDMATGTWAACVLVIWVLASRVTDATPSDAAGAIAGAALVVFWLLIAALAALTVTGALRLFYWRAATPEAERGAKRRALIVKHIAFAVIYGGGTLWAWSMLPPVVG